VESVERVALVDVKDLLLIGEALPFRVLDSHARMLLNEGQLIASERQFDMLMERGAWVERPQVESAAALRAAAAPTHGRAVRQLTLFDQWEKLLWDLDDLTRRLARGKAAAAEVSGLALQVQALMERDADVALYLCIRQDDKRPALYAYTHGLHCAVVCTLAARLLKWTPAQIQSLACAALTMNSAMAELQGQMAEQSEPPSQKQLGLIRAHPAASVALLGRAGVQDALWLDIVQNHHESPDGSGYPTGVTAICDEAQLLRLADVFMAKVSPRAIRAAMAPNTAARQLFQQHGSSPVGIAVIRSIGAYPPGSLVLLKSGEVAVVSRRAVSGTAPQVATLSNRQGEPVVDTRLLDSAAADHAITASLPPDARFQRFAAERVYGMALA